MVYPYLHYYMGQKKMLDNFVDKYRLILNLLEAPAEKGDTVGYRGLEFKVTRTENGGVERCTVTRITTLMREEVLEEEE